jgi:HEAT repeats
MARWLRATGVVVAFGLMAWSGMGSSTASAQTRERDVTITGPRGKTIDRQFKSTVTPGGLDRQTTITRPGGTFTRDVHIARPGPPIVAPPPMRGWVGGPRPPVVLQRNVFVGPRGGVSGGEALGIGMLGAAVGTGAGYLLGRATAPQPVVIGQPMVVATAPPAMVMGAPPPIVVTQPAMVLQAAPLPPPNPEVNQAIGRLASWYESTRKESCYILGRLGDPRAVPALVDILKNDHSQNVRIAAAAAIGQIGDPGSAIYLQRASVYDKKQEVRDAAALAMARMPRPAPVTATEPPPTAVTRSAPAPTDLQPLANESRDVPPPPPTPVLPSSGGTRR